MIILRNKYFGKIAYELYGDKEGDKDYKPSKAEKALGYGTGLAIGGSLAGMVVSNKKFKKAGGKRLSKLSEFADEINKNQRGVVINDKKLLQIQGKNGFIDEKTLDKLYNEGKLIEISSNSGNKRYLFKQQVENAIERGDVISHNPGQYKNIRTAEKIRKISGAGLPIAAGMALGTLALRKRRKIEQEKNKN